MKKKEDLRIIKTKKSLYDGLIKLMRKKAFENIRVSEICEVALVNRSTFYDHFTDKYELLEDMIKTVQESFVDELSTFEGEKNSRKFFFKFISLLYDHIFDNYDFYSGIFKINCSGVAKDLLKSKAIKDVTYRLKDDTNNIVTAEFIARFYVSAIIEVGIMAIEQPNKINKDEFFKCLGELIPDLVYERFI